MIGACGALSHILQLRPAPAPVEIDRDGLCAGQQTEFAEQIRRITRAADLPLLVDADHGYGNALNVMRTVQELETAGVAAMTIEDTELPRPYGDGTTRLVSLAEGLRRTVEYYATEEVRAAGERAPAIRPVRESANASVASGL